MWRTILNFLNVSAACGLALALSACRPAEKVQVAAPRIQGELIAGGAAAAHAAPINVATTAPTATAPAIATVSTVASAPTPAPAVAPAASNDGYATLGFDRLAAYNFEVDDTPWTNSTSAPDRADAQIPATVKAFDDKKVSIRGFMLPLKVDDGVVTEFLIMKDQSTCCFGNVPKINEWVNVKTAGKGIKPIMDVPISIEGTLHVGATRENGYLVGIYEMDGDKLIMAKN
jgi:hypothetical protein